MWRAIWLTISVFVDVVVIYGCVASGWIALCWIGEQARIGKCVCVPVSTSW